MKIAICHPSLTTRGGIARVALYLARHFDADVFTGCLEPEKTYKELLDGLRFHTPSFPISSLPISHSSVLMQELTSLWYRGLDLEDEFDLTIPLCETDKYVCINNHPNIWYCNNILETLYDPHKFYSRTYRRRFLFPLYRRWKRSRDKKVVRDHVERIIANSKNMAHKIKEYHGRDSEVVYPPVNTTMLRCEDYQDFFLVVQGLTSRRRTSLIVEAFKHMPDKKVLIVGEGPERKKLENQAKRYKNIRFSDRISEEELLDLYARCLATIFVSIDEGFGLPAVESMAAGKPCIAADEGGFKETVIDKETGFLIKPTIKELIAAVENLSPEKAEDMKKNCIKRAREFDIKLFYKKFDKIVKQS